MQRTSRRHGFTLIELLIVIAIIGILAGMIFPAVGYVREKARKDECLNNLRQWGVAMQGYLDDHQGRFPSYKAEVDAVGAWFNVLPPYVGATPLREMGGKLPHPGSGAFISQTLHADAGKSAFLQRCPALIVDPDSKTQCGTGFVQSQSEHLCRLWRQHRNDCFRQIQIRTGTHAFQIQFTAIGHD